LSINAADLAAVDVFNSDGLVGKVPDLYIGRDLNLFPIKKNGLPSFRPLQKEAIEEVLDHVQTKKYIRIDAPVGTGKSAINYTSALNIGTRAIYLTTHKQLQDQLESDEWEHVYSLKGKNAYVCPLCTNMDESRVVYCDGSCRARDSYVHLYNHCTVSPKQKWKPSPDTAKEFFKNVTDRLQQSIDTPEDRLGFRNLKDFREYCRYLIEHRIVNNEHLRDICYTATDPTARRMMELSSVDIGDISMSPPLASALSAVACHHTPIECPYRAAKFMASNVARVAVLNPDIYWGFKCLPPKVNPFRDFDAIIIDEAHNMSGVMVRVFDAELNAHMVGEKYGIDILNIDGIQYDKENGIPPTVKDFFFRGRALSLAGMAFMSFFKSAITSGGSAMTVARHFEPGDFSMLTGVTQETIKSFMVALSRIREGASEFDFPELFMDAMSSDKQETDDPEQIGMNLGGSMEEEAEPHMATRFFIRSMFKEYCSSKFGIKIEDDFCVDLFNPRMKLQAVVRAAGKKSGTKDVMAKTYETMCEDGDKYFNSFYSSIKHIFRLSNCFIASVYENDYYNKITGDTVKKGKFLRFVPVYTGSLLRNTFYTRDKDNPETNPNMKPDYKVIVSSGTWPNPKSMVKALGVDMTSDMSECATVQISKRFDRERRPVFINTLYNQFSFSDKMSDEEKGKFHRGDSYYYSNQPYTQKWVDEIDSLIKFIHKLNPGYNIVIHTVSHRITKMLVEHTKLFSPKWLVHLNEYEEAPINKRSKDKLEIETKDVLMAKFIKGEGQGLVFVSPSLKEGCDFKGDRCRAQIILKKPIPYFGDPFHRFHASKDKSYMETMAAIDMMQMCGRNVRSHEDWGMTFIYDTAATRILGFLLKDPKMMATYRSMSHIAKLPYDTTERFVKYDYITEAVVRSNGLPVWPLDPSRRIKIWESMFV